MKLKAEHGALEVKGHGIRLTQFSTDKEIQSALDVAPHLAQFIDGIEDKSEKKIEKKVQSKVEKDDKGSK